MELRELTNMFKCEYAHSACEGLGWIIPFLSLADARGTATTVLSNFVRNPAMRTTVLRTTSVRRSAWPLDQNDAALLSNRS
jgi:predicted glycosyl hydrolase (DUF1957 family)